ncbi:hypothetical protein GCM10011273_18330 [Asticcacaulis endophyticus]|uniref:Uncharacterized protein n=1 Tax=Asticcacaulis endophyticus TaxID=1395890 RepID=A0A918USS2_9CAUL|nr:hypothetical protein GCM10011273_18330 [Asticcacaulis endophyticus]
MTERGALKGYSANLTPRQSARLTAAQEYKRIMDSHQSFKTGAIRSAGAGAGSGLSL